MGASSLTLPTNYSATLLMLQMLHKQAASAEARLWFKWKVVEKAEFLFHKHWYAYKLSTHPSNIWYLWIWKLKDGKQVGISVCLIAGIVSIQTSLTQSHVHAAAQDTKLHCRLQGFTTQLYSCFSLVSFREWVCLKWNWTTLKST